VSKDAGPAEGAGVSEEFRSVLPSLGLPEERCGSARGSQLTSAERDLYRWILRRFASGEVPTLKQVRTAARTRGVEADAALRRMVELDLVQRSSGGAIDCAHPFSARPLGHTVILDDGTKLLAMCAVDALGIPAMLHHGSVIHSADPRTGRPIRIEVSGLGEVNIADPSDAVILCAVADGPGPLSTLCCPLVNTFESSATAERFLGSHPELSGSILSLDDAAACGGIVFGGVLD
jgi:Alkylmercury lyase